MTLEHESVAPAKMSGAERELVAQAEYILTEALKSNEVPLDSAVAVLAKTMEITERFKYLDGKLKKKLLLEVLTRIAAGADGVVGTADDLIPATTMATLKVLLEGDLVDQTVNLISDVARGRFKIGDFAALGQTAMAAVTAAGGPAKVFSSCLPCLGGGAGSATVAVTTTQK
jgi:hypothetical protein